jgi:hypothetical protein
MRVSLGFLSILLAAGCSPARSAGGAETSECEKAVARAHQAGADSVFSDATGLVQRCPDAMAVALAALWAAPRVTPWQAHHLRAVSAVVEDERLASAIEAVVADPGRPVETRLEGLTTLSYYLEPGRWVEFTFVKNQLDSASLRILAGSTDSPMRGDGSQPISPAFPVRFRQMLETLRQDDSSSVVRTAARRFLVILDAVDLQRQQPPKTPAPPGS